MFVNIRVLYKVKVVLKKKTIYINFLKNDDDNTGNNTNNNCCNYIIDENY